MAQAKAAAAASGGGAPAKAGGKVKKKVKKNVPKGICHIQATFNNTIVTISDVYGNTIACSSAGARGFKGSRKSTPFAAQVAAEDAARKAGEHGMRARADVHRLGRAAEARDLFGLTIVMITHDLDLLWQVADRVAVLAGGKVQGVGSMSELARMDNPAIRKFFDGPRGRAAQEQERRQAHAPNDGKSEERPSKPK